MANAAFQLETGDGIDQDRQGVLYGYQQATQQGDVKAQSKLQALSAEFIQRHSR
jgi:TPR repeat protein